MCVHQKAVGTNLKVVRPESVDISIASHARSLMLGLNKTARVPFDLIKLIEKCGAAMAPWPHRPHRCLRPCVTMQCTITCTDAVCVHHVRTLYDHHA